MTLPDERINSINGARRLLDDLADRSYSLQKVSEEE